MYDAVVVGGGLIGAACADALAGEGARVALFESGPFAREASWAGAGILHPIHPWNYPEPLHPLLRAAPAEHERCAADLRARVGIDVELERSGLVLMGDQVDRLADWCGAAIPHERVVDGLLLPAACHVRNHRLAHALLEGARRRGADLFEHTPVTALREEAVDTPRGRIAARHIVLCAGAWSARLQPSLQVEPVRGQILLYRGAPGAVPHMIVFPQGEYVVPRRDGKLLFGSTLEHVGFDARPTRDAYVRLAERARELVGLAPDDILAAWAGLRPASPSLLPYLGRDPNRSDVIYACGHYRNGILLAPLTGRIVADVVARRASGWDLACFAPATNSETD